MRTFGSPANQPREPNVRAPKSATRIEQIAALLVYAPEGPAGTLTNRAGTPERAERETAA
jgi:hypothetical protein